MLEPTELLHTTSTQSPFYSSMTFVTWAAAAFTLYGSPDGLLLYFISGIWFRPFMML